MDAHGVDAHGVDADAAGREEALLAAIRAGDAAAFTELVESLHAPLVRLARSYVPAALAEEAVQDTWVAVLRSIDAFEGRSTLRTWIFRIMLNRVRTMAGREARMVPFAALGPAEPTGPAVAYDRLDHPELGPAYWPQAPGTWAGLPDERLLAAEVRAVVGKAIETLPSAQREVLTLRDVEGWAAEEVCGALGISAVNQRVLLHRARVSVRAALEEYFDG